MKLLRIFFLLFFSLYLYAGNLSLTQEEKDFLSQHPSIRVSSELNWPPFDFMIGNKPAGYSIDILNLIAKKIDINFKYIKGYKRTTLWDMFKKREIDIIHPLVKLEERQHFGNYTKSFYNGIYVFVTKQETPKIEQINTLFGKTIATPKEWIHANFLQKNFPQINLLFTNTQEEAYQAVEKGKAYATVELDAVAYYNLKKNMNKKLKLNTNFLEQSQKNSSWHYLIRKDWPLMHSIFKKAYASITLKEIDKIQQKWFAKEANQKINNSFYTLKELNWIKQKSFIKLAYVKYWDNKNISKLHVEKAYASLLSKYSNISVQLVSFDTWGEALEEAKTGQNVDGVFYLVRDKNGEQDFNYLPAYFFMPAYLFTNYKNQNIKSLKDLKNKNIYTVKGTSFSQFLKSLPYNITPIKLDSERKIIEKLANSQEDEAGIVYNISTDFTKEGNVKVVKKIYNEYGNVHVGVSKTHKEAYSILEKAHNNIPKEELAKIKNSLFQKHTITLSPNEHIYLHNRDNIHLCINPNWMPFSDFDGIKPIGMIADFTELISNSIDKKITVPFVSNWEESLQEAEKGRCDIISLLKKTPQREMYLNFTKPLLKVPYVVASTKDKIYIDSFMDIKDEIFTVVKGTPVAKDIKRIYPNINFIHVKNIKEGLEKVLQGKAYGFIDISASIAHAVEKFEYLNFRIVSRLHIGTELAFGVKKKDEMLYSIMKKSVNNISDEQIHKIYSKWASFQKERVIDYSLLWKIIVGGLGIFFFGVFWNRKITKTNKLLQEAHKEIERKNIELERLATTDKLTQLMNRTKIDEVLENEIKRSKRYKHAFSFCILDIDNFKKVNDTYGHQVGDIVLIELAKLLKKNTREIDFAGRWGGEEFVIIFPETSMEQANVICENICKKVRLYNFPEAKKQTISIGFTVFQAGDTEEKLTKRADEALYEAKRSGKDKVVFG